MSSALEVAGGGRKLRRRVHSTSSGLAEAQALLTASSPVPEFRPQPEQHLSSPEPLSVAEALLQIGGNGDVGVNLGDAAFAVPVPDIQGASDAGPRDMSHWYQLVEPYQTHVYHWQDANGTGCDKDNKDDDDNQGNDDSKSDEDDTGCINDVVEEQESRGSDCNDGCDGDPACVDTAALKQDAHGVAESESSLVFKTSPSQPSERYETADGDIVAPPTPPSARGSKSPLRSRTFVAGDAVEGHTAPDRVTLNSRRYVHSYYFIVVFALVVCWFNKVQPLLEKAWVRHDGDPTLPFVTVLSTIAAVLGLGGNSLVVSYVLSLVHAVACVAYYVAAPADNEAAALFMVTASLVYFFLDVIVVPEYFFGHVDMLLHHACAAGGLLYILNAIAASYAVGGPVFVRSSLWPFYKDLLLVELSTIFLSAKALWKVARPSVPHASDAVAKVLQVAFSVAFAGTRLLYLPFLLVWHKSIPSAIMVPLVLLFGLQLHWAWKFAHGGTGTNGTGVATVA